MAPRVLWHSWPMALRTKGGPHGPSLKAEKLWEAGFALGGVSCRFQRGFPH